MMVCLRHKRPSREHEVPVLPSCGCRSRIFPPKKRYREGRIFGFHSIGFPARLPGNAPGPEGATAARAALLSRCGRLEAPRGFLSSQHWNLCATGQWQALAAVSGGPRRRRSREEPAPFPVLLASPVSGLEDRPHPTGGPIAPALFQVSARNRLLRFRIIFPPNRP